MTEALSFAGGLALGFVAGVIATVQVFLRMHRNSLPPKDR